MPGRPGNYVPSEWRSWAAEYTSTEPLDAKLAALSRSGPFTFELTLRRSMLLYADPPAPTKASYKDIDGTTSVDLTTGAVATFTATDKFLREQAMVALPGSRQVLINGGMRTGDSWDASPTVSEAAPGPAQTSSAGKRVGAAHRCRCLIRRRPETKARDPPSSGARAAR